MNILHTVQAYHPSVGGSQEVIRQISEALVERGHSVTVATSWVAARTEMQLNGVQIEQFKVEGNAVHGIRGDVKRYQEYLLDGRFDVMLNYAAQQWATDLVFPVLGDLRYRKVLVPCGFSALYYPSYECYFASLPNILRGYDHLVFHAENYRDTYFSREHGLNHFSVIPNGASAEEFGILHHGFRDRYGIPVGVPLLLTVGSHTGGKGHRLAMEAFQQARIGQSCLIVIGNEYSRLGCMADCRRRAGWHNLVSLGKKRILLLDPPRADVVAAFQAADLFVFGSNVEYSPLVLFEAMASRTPFVTVACGNAVEIAAWGRSGVVVPTRTRSNGLVDAEPAVVARAVEDLMASPAERERMGEAGFQAWQARFTWDLIAAEYEQLYLRLLNV